MEYVIFVLILIFLFVLIYIVTTNSQDKQISQLLAHISLTSITVPISIIDETTMEVCTDSLKKYCQSWNYNYNDTSTSTESNSINSGFILHIKDSSINVNLNRSLDVLANIGLNTKYIAFENSSSYITNNSNITLEQIHDEINNAELPPQLITNILSEGYPYILQNGILLHRDYLNYIFQNVDTRFEIPIIMPSRIPSRILEPESKKPSKIPKIIHQTFETRCLPNGMALAAHSWINRNPDYEYRYYDEHDRREFIKLNFDPKVLIAYDSLIPGAYKADLWRYCVIYIEGGVYIDIKMGALVPLTRLIPPDTDLMIINDTHDMTLYNAFFAATPKHPALLKTIELVTERVGNKEYGNHILYPTGPMAMGSTILPMYGFEHHAPNGRHFINNEIIQVYSHIKNGDETTIVDIDNTKLVRTRYDHSITESYINRITGRPHYRFLWNSHAIYKR